MQEYRRWYDKDPMLKEALELLRIQPDDKQISATDYLIELQEEVAKDVLERISEIIETYSNSGQRWYDKDPTLLKGVELLRLAPPEMQRKAALKLLTALENQSNEEDSDNE